MPGSSSPRCLPSLHTSICCTSISPGCCPPLSLCSCRFLLRELSPARRSRTGSCALFIASLPGQAFPEHPPEGRASALLPGCSSPRTILPDLLPSWQVRKLGSGPAHCAWSFLCAPLKTSASPGQGFLSVWVTLVSPGPSTAPGTQEVLKNAWALEELTREGSYSSFI